MQKQAAPTRFRVAALGSALVLALFASIALGQTILAQDSTPATGTGNCVSVAMGTPSAEKPTETSGSATCVEIGMHDIFFDANLITIPADTDVTFILKSDGAALHDFAINDHNNKDVANLKVDLDVDPGKSGEVTINAPAGDYYFYCDQPGHEAASMWGILRVEKGATISVESVKDPKATS